MKVNITRHVEVPGKGKRFCRVNPKTGDALVEGVPVKTEGRFYIDWLENGRRKRRAAGESYTAAVQQAASQSKLVTLHRDAKDVSPEHAAALEAIVTRTEGRSLRLAIDEYLQETRAQKSKKTYAVYKIGLSYFLESCSKTTLEEIRRTDLLAFKTYLKRTKNQSDRSCRNKFENVMTFLKHFRVAADLNIKPNDWPKYTEGVVETYSPQDLSAFFAACTEAQLVWFKFFRFTAMREQEVMHVSWGDIDFERSVVTVRENKQFGWTPKMNKSREIPIPSELLNLLKKLKSKRDAKCGLVFPTTGCKPKRDFLDECKAIAERAKLDPADFWLHKFRATRITEWARALNTDSSMLMAGHDDYESHKRYLGKEKIDVLQEKIEQMNMNGGSDGRGQA